MQRILVAMIVFLLIGVQAKAGDWRGNETIEDGVKHIVNPGEPMEGPVDWNATESWRCDEDVVIFGRIQNMVVDSEGRTYVLDEQLDQVHVIGAGGDYIEAIGGEGEGPGEFRGANQIGIFPNGTICVLQNMPARIVLLTRDGTAAGDHPIPREKGGGSPFLNGGAISGDALVLELAELKIREVSFGLQTRFVRIDSEGNVVSTYWDRLQEVNAADITFDERADDSVVWSVANGGMFYINDDWTKYRVEVRNPHGGMEYVVTRDYEPRQRTKREFDAIKRQMDNGDISPDTKVSDTSRNITRIVPREHGKFWVLTSRGEMDGPEGLVARFDVFDDQGRYIRVVNIHAESYRSGVDAFYIVDDYLFVATNTGAFPLEEEEPDGVSLVCFRLGG